jgi:hypothetical protein
MLSYNKFRQAPIAAERRRDHAALHVGQIQHMIAGSDMSEFSKPLQVYVVAIADRRSPTRTRLL